MGAIESSQVYYLSQAYIILFLVLVGFIYHLIRNKEYKNTLPASIIIGIILGLLLNSAKSLTFFLGETLIFIVLISLGGFLAVGLKKVMNSNATEKPYETSGTLPSYKKWWNTQSLRNQAIIIISVCLLCIVLITSTSLILNPVKNPVQLSLNLPFLNQTEADEALKEGTNILIISNNTTQYTLNGSSEAGATIKITSNDLGIYNQTIPLDAEGNFAYNLNIPQNVTIIKITLEATKPGKETSFFNLTIKKQNNLE
jgi:hypothetical protein